jgi:serine/threonine-protein kinase
MRAAEDIVLGRYELQEELGRGASSVVYRARDRLTGAAVAVKRLSDDALRSVLQTRGGTASIARDARRLRALDHAVIARVLDAAITPESGVIVLELVQAPDLRRHATRTPLPLDTALWIAERVADGLYHAHERRIVHGDVKPANILVDLAAGRVKLVDLSIHGASAGPALEGTLAYMAPERICGAAPSARGDQFALGVVLYRLVCLAPPFPARTRPQLAWDLAYAPHLPAQCRVPALPRDVSTIIDRVLAKQPCARYPSTRDLAHALHDARAALRARERAHEAGESYAFGG